MKICPKILQVYSLKSITSTDYYYVKRLAQCIIKACCKRYFIKLKDLRANAKYGDFSQSFSRMIQVVSLGLSFITFKV